MTNNCWGIIERVGHLSPNSEDTPAELSEALKSCAEEWYLEDRQVSMKGQRGAPDWLGFEMQLWKLGEAIRQVMAKRPEWRESEPLLQSIVGIVRDSRFGKGRQSFIELVARYGTADDRRVLLEILEQPDISGHVVKGLRKARIPGAEKQVQALLESRQPSWIKKEARKYLKLQS